MKTLLETLNYQPVQFFDDELESPESSIPSFFKDHPLHLTRGIIAELYECWINQNEENLEGTTLTLTEMMRFVHDVNHLINLSYIVGHHYETTNNLRGQNP